MGSNPSILLLSPRVISRSQWSYSLFCELYSKAKGKKISSPSYHLALPLIAALIKKELPNSYIEIIDENIQSIKNKNIWDLVCISSTTSQVKRAYALCRAFPKNTPVILGGAHFEKYDEDVFNEAIRYSKTVVFGKTDNTWKDIINDFANAKLKQCYIDRDNQRGSISTLTPKFELLPLESYLYRVLETSRGCDRRCFFCNVSHNPKFKPVENVVDEIKYLRIVENKLNSDHRSIFFADCLLNTKGKGIERSKLLMESLIKYKETRYLNDELSWSGQVDYHIADEPELISLMHRAGAQRLLIGFESFYDNFDKDIGKLTPAQKKDYFIKVIQTVRNEGIDIIASFIIGSDYEPESIFSELYDFVNEASLSAVQVLVLTPFPGTQSYRTFKKKHRLIKGKDGNIDWSMYDCHNFVFRTKNLKRKLFDYKELIKKIYDMNEMIPRIIRRGEVFFDKSAKKTLISDLLLAANYQNLAKRIRKNF